MKKQLVLLITLALLVIVGAVRAQTNTLPDYAPPFTFSGAGTNVGNALNRVATDGAAVFGKISFTNPLDVAVIGIKNGKLSGGGLSISQTPSNSIVGVGFGLFAMQKETPTAITYKGKPQTVPVKGWDFYDASLNLSVSTVETIPMLGIPLTLRIESGPAVRLTGAATVLEQSAAYGTVNLDWINGWPIRVGGGVIHCSDLAFNNKALPFFLFSVNHKF